MILWHVVQFAGCLLRKLGSRDATRTLVRNLGQVSCLWKLEILGPGLLEVVEGREVLLGRHFSTSLELVRAPVGRRTPQESPLIVMNQAPLGIECHSGLVRRSPWVPGTTGSLRYRPE